MKKTKYRRRFFFFFVCHHPSIIIWKGTFRYLSNEMHSDLSTVWKSYCLSVSYWMVGCLNLWHWHSKHIFFLNNFLFFSKCYLFGFRIPLFFHERVCGSFCSFFFISCAELSLSQYAHHGINSMWLFFRFKFNRRKNIFSFCPDKSNYLETKENIEIRILWN